MGQEARHGRGLRQDRKTTSRRIRSGERQALGTGRSAQEGRTVSNLDDESLARGFVLQGFDRSTEELKIELHLSPVPIDRLRALFDAGGDPEICDAYPLDAGKARALAPLVSEPIDTERYDFFLQRYA
jgi:hypothetical protein